MSTGPRKRSSSSRIDAREVRSELQGRIRELYSLPNGEFHTIPFPGGAYEVPDEVGDGRPLLVVMNYETVSVPLDLRQPPPEVDSIFQYRNADGKLRELRNNLVFVVADQRSIENMKTLVRRRLALAELRKPENQRDLADYQKKKIDGEFETLRNSVAMAIHQCYRHLFYPSSNPMKVEQRIGRIDRLGQKYPKVRIINLAYKGTVEADVYFVVGARIQLFQGIVGKLQPILSRLPKQIEQVLLETADNRDALRQRFLAEVDQQVAAAERTSLDIDTASFESLEVPPLPEPAMTLDQIDCALRDGRALPKEVEWKPLDPRSYSMRMPGMAAAVRVTTDADVFEYSGENHQLFSPGGQLFDATQLVGTGDGEAAEGDGICWIATPADGGVPRFFLRTKFGLEEITTLEHLQLRLRLVAPGPPPDNDAARGALLRIV